jgi:hypothetical protein
MLMPESMTENPWESPFLLFAAATTLALLFVVWAIYRRRRAPQTTQSYEAAPAVRAVPDVLRCTSGCGEPATEPSPSLTRSRDDYFRRLYGAPPRYRRTIDRMGIPAYCRAHAHVADARLDKWIFDERARATTSNSEAAGRAARVVAELPTQVAEELTDEQKKNAKKRTSNVVPLVSNGS